MFEYGSGNGTLWWATRTVLVRAVENNREWFERIKSKTPSNVELFLQDLDDSTAYEAKITEFETLYDVIVIDGRRRNKCAAKSLSRISSSGIIVFDNSDRPEYRPGINLLIEHGFKKIEFKGFCPIVNFKSETSIFYRDGNIIGI